MHSDVSLRETTYRKAGLLPRRPLPTNLTNFSVEHYGNDKYHFSVFYAGHQVFTFTKNLGGETYEIIAHDEVLFAECGFTGYAPAVLHAFAQKLKPR